MDFGLLIVPDAAAAATQARLAEANGFSRYWVPDSKLMAADPYVALAAAALATRRIVLGAGVAIAGKRIAPVTACAIASVGALAPGRVVLGLGTGNSARCSRCILSRCARREASSICLARASGK